MGGSPDPLLVLTRRRFLQLGAVAGGATLLGESFGCSSLAPTSGNGAKATGFPAPELEEATLAQLRAGLESGRWTSRQLTGMYLDRIAAMDRRGPGLSSVMETNPDALDIATAMDVERSGGRIRGPLHGIPVLLKDTVGTRDRMATSAGSLALEGNHVTEDSEVARRLRAAGAVILGKTNVSEWSGFRASRAVSGWSARGGLTRNSYALDRTAGGSSSGSAVAVAASLCAAAVGGETNGSIVFPASSSGIVGLRPTVGLVSRRGMVPVSVTRDTPGPMARTVEDAAILLGVLAGVDPGDPRTALAEEQIRPDYTAFLDRDGLRGMRIGVNRQFMGVVPEADMVMERALDTLRHQGAIVVDPADIPNLDRAGRPFVTLLHYELKASLDEYLRTLEPDVPVRSLEDVIAFNRANRDKEMALFGQDVFLAAEKMGPLTDAAYVEARAAVRQSARIEGIDWIMDRHGLDAMVGPGSRPAWRIDPIRPDLVGGGSSGPVAIAGYPAVTVPMGSVYGMPVGISFSGRAWSEPTLLRMAYAFEQATKHRRPPAYPTHSDDRLD